MQFCNEIEFIKLLINATKEYCTVNVVKNLLAYTVTERHLCKMKVTFMVIINRLLPPTKAYALQRIVLLLQTCKN
jgi:hypothetical protein